MTARYAALAVLVACSKSAPPADPALVGKWSTGTTASDGVHGTNATYELRGDGTFVMDGYPPIHVAGKWTATEHTGRKLHLVLRDQQMTAPGAEPSRWGDQDGWAELAADGKSFAWNGQTYTRN